MDHHTNSGPLGAPELALVPHPPGPAPTPARGWVDALVAILDRYTGTAHPDAPRVRLTVTVAWAGVWDRVVSEADAGPLGAALRAHLDRLSDIEYPTATAHLWLTRPVPVSVVDPPPAAFEPEYLYSYGGTTNLRGAL